MNSYSLQLGLNGQFPPQRNPNDQRPYDPYAPPLAGHYHPQHPQAQPYYPPPYPIHPAFPGAPTNQYPDVNPAMRRPFHGPPAKKPSTLKDRLFGLTVGQEVEVCLRSNVFVVGLVVSVLTFFEKIAGWGYEIRYRTLGGGESTDVFGVDHIRTL